MNINIKDVLTLSNNNEYIVMSKVNYENKEYLYLTNFNDFTDIIFCYLDNDEIVVSNDKDLNKKLLPLFYEVMEKNK